MSPRPEREELPEREEGEDRDTKGEKWRDRETERNKRTKGEGARSVKRPPIRTGPGETQPETVGHTGPLLDESTKSQRAWRPVYLQGRGGSRSGGWHCGNTACMLEWPPSHSGSQWVCHLCLHYWVEVQVGPVLSTSLSPGLAWEECQ
jgi:hypothetical protein